MNPHVFEQKDLQKRKQKGVMEAQCHNSYEQMPVLELLDGLKIAEPPAWATEEPEPVNEKTVRIFLASSAELREDRDAFDLYLRQQNDRLRNEGYYLQIVRWENFLDAMSETRLQDEYNKQVRDCDIFVSLFKTKTGKYTEEEFDVAHETFQQHGKPLIYTYFCDVQIPIDQADSPDVKSLGKFRKKLDKLGHFHTSYDGIENLKRHFRDQFDKLRDDGKL